MMVAKHFECTKCHWIFHFKMIRMVNFIFCIFYLNKMPRAQKETQLTWCMEELLWVIVLELLPADCNLAGGSQRKNKLTLWRQMMVEKGQHVQRPQPLPYFALQLQVNLFDPTYWALISLMCTSVYKMECEDLWEHCPITTPTNMSNNNKNGDTEMNTYCHNMNYSCSKFTTPQKIILCFFYFGVVYPL